MNIYKQTIVILDLYLRFKFMTNSSLDEHLINATPFIAYTIVLFISIIIVNL